MDKNNLFFPPKTLKTYLTYFGFILQYAHFFTMEQDERAKPLFNSVPKDKILDQSKTRLTRIVTKVLHTLTQRLVTEQVSYYKKKKKNHLSALTLSQTTHFRLFQTERVCIRQFDK